ncbi:MAG: gliding motility-associated C-terminal domain-containing protein [Marinoscillum sp.]|uniref:T9SS type B sorting domain-containing protein n=1 Tax=Marinoscillum sp. TaxID=2024838 RepID=UPI0032FB1101
MLRIISTYLLSVVLWAATFSSQLLATDLTDCSGVVFNPNIIIEDGFDVPSGECAIIDVNIGFIDGSIIVENNATLYIYGNIDYIDGKIHVHTGGQLFIYGDIAGMSNDIIADEGTIEMFGSVTSEGKVTINDPGVFQMTGAQLHLSPAGDIALDGGSAMFIMNDFSSVTQDLGKFDNKGNNSNIQLDESGNTLYTIDFQGLKGDFLGSGPTYSDIPPTQSKRIIVSETNGNTITAENGPSDYVSVVLGASPTLPVTITLFSSDVAEGTVSPISITFTSLNWDTPQVITITGTDDNVAERTRVYELITSNAVSGDLQYNGMIVPDVVVLNRDNGLNGTNTYNIFAPTADGSTITSKEDSVAVITVADLGFADDDGDDIDKLQVSTLPVKGILFQDNAPQNNAYDVGEELSVNDTITKAEIDNNEFNYIPDSQEVGNSYASFDFYVNDGEVYSDASATITFDIVAVNDSPVFTLTGDLNVDDNQASYSYLNFFSGAGDGDPELTQNLTYQISTDDPSIFSVLPSIDFGTGELTFTLANKVSVVANITVTVTDDGGTVNGGLDETTKTFKINVFDEPQSKLETIPAGSYIVDMGSLSPTIGNSLKPYGLIFDLTSNYQVPVKIAIRMDKEKDEIDFSHEGRDYRGAPFIISAEYRTDSVNAVLDEWELQGVEGYTTTTEALNVPIYVTFTAYTTWTVDQDNEAIAANYFDNAGIPLTSYTVKPPSALDGTDDIFILPHADPSWANHGNLYNWNKSVDEGGEGGWIWAGCHAVSVLESLVNPADVTEQMNFLTTNSLVSYLAHDDGSVPYSYDYPAHPFMQFMQDLDAASVNGSEQVYLPSKAQGSSWLSSTKIAVWDPDQSDVVNGIITDGEAAVLAFGHSFGDPRNGKVLYQGGHDLDGGNIANIAAQRAFFNFSILAPVGKVPIVDSISVPAYMDKAQDYDLSISATTRDGSTPSYYWSSGCGGSFDDPTSSTPTYTSPSVVTVTTCIITVTITDSNGRQTFESVSVTMTPNETPTFTSLTSPLEAGILTDEFEITFAELEAASDASDVEGPIAGYLVTNLNGGTLSLGTSSGVATPYAAGSNDTINASINAYWTPSSTGFTSAFDIVALDSEGSNSVTDIPVNIKVVGFSVTESGGTTVTSEAGGTDFISIVLDVQPTTDVQLDLVISPTSVASVNVASVTFDNTNWDTPQVITITGQDDATPVDGDDPYTITFSVNTGASDDDFDLMTDQVIAALNVDNDDPGFTITPLSGITVNESGTTANFTISLQSSPSAAVDVTLWSNDLTEGDVNPKTFSFTNLNWNAANSFTVTGADDLVEDGDINYLIVLDPAVSGDPTYDNMDPADVTVTTADNDVSGIQVTLSGGSTVTSETGTTDTVWVQLNTEPSSDVVIDVTSANLSEGTVSPAQLTFTDTDWNVAQLIIVTGVNDNVDDGDVTYNLVLAVDDAASDDVYDAVPNQLVSVTNQNDDVAGILVSPTSLTMSESGAPENFSIVLNSQPTQNVSISVSSSNTGEATVNVSSVTFTPGTWNTPKQVAVTGQDDTQVDGNSSVTILVATATSTDSKYSGMNPDDVAATIQDDDTARFIVTPTSLSMNEGTTGTFDVVLGDEPQGTVNLTLSSSNSAQASIDFTNLSFDNSNWSVAQTVTVTGEEDANLISESPSITISVDASSDDAFDTLNNQVVNVTLADNDLAGFTVTPLSLSVNEGSTNTFTVVLDAEPSSDVMISLTSSNTAAATVDLSSVVFDNTDWSVAQTVTVTGVEDANVISETPTITASVVDASSDDAFDTLNNQVVNVTLADNDLAGFTVTPLTLSVSEGSTNTFTVVLDAEPSSDVTISLTSSNTAAATVDLSSVVFDNTDWSVARTVTITGVEDANVISETPTITASIVDASSDDAFDTLNNQVVNVTLADNDEAGFTLTPLSLSVNEGGTNTFTVVLDAEPADEVFIDFTSSDHSAAITDYSRMSFDATNWNISKTVTVSGVEDANLVSETPTITLSVDASSDDAFDTLNNQVVNVTLADNDLAGFTVTPLSLSVNEGSTNTFTVVLDAEPADEVFIDFTSSDHTAAITDYSRMSFDATNWNISKTVTVSGVEDANLVSETPVITLSVDASSDDAFDTLANEEVNITLTDNDEAGFIVTPDLINLEEGEAGSLSVVLSSAPSAEVTISMANSHESIISLDQLELTFTAGNWDTPQSVIVTALEDDNMVSETATITVSVSASADASFTALTAKDVEVNVSDPDEAAFTVTPKDISTTEGSSATFNVVLNIEPTSPVFIDFESSDPAAGITDYSRISFDAGNWESPRVITVTGIEDMDLRSEALIITASVAATSDPEFVGLSAQDVSVSIADDDTAGLVVSPQSLSVDENSSEIFDVRLSHEPLSDVVLSITLSNDATLEINPVQITFTTANWNLAQEIIVNASETGVLEDLKETSTISVSTSDDALYLDAPDQTVDLTVVSINNQPEITGQVLLETTEDTPISIDLSDLMVSDVDNEYPTDFELIIFNGSNYSISGNTITPAANYNGILTVPVAVNDGGLDSEVFDLEITVSDVNDAPSFVKGNDISIDEDTGKQSLDGWANSLSWGANNESNQTLSFVFSTTNDGLFESGPSMNESGDLTFESKWNAFGTAEITVILKDDGGTLNGGVDTSEPQVFNLEILPINDQPTIIKHTAPEVFSGVVFDIELTSLVVADPDNNFPEEFKLFVLEGDHYSFTGKSVIIDAGYTGALDVMVKVSDGELESEPYPYTVNTEVLDNVPPSIRSQEAVTIVEDSFYALTKADLIIEDEDSSEDELSIEIQQGNLYQFDGLTITPHENFNGLLAVNIVVNDGEELSEVFQFMIQVTPVNDAPITMADTFEVALGETLTANVLENDADIESDELTTQLNQNNTTHSEFELSEDGNFIFRSNDVIGEYVQFYTVCDKGAPSMCAEGMIIITVVGEDFDGDGIPDDVEIGAGDTDEDGTPDYQDTDSDNDGLSDQLEAGDDPTEPVDTDGDGLPDYRDLDSDDDTRPDHIEGFDDCDNDGIANYIDADELCERILAAQGFSPNGDGINDEWIIEGIDEYPDNVVQIFNRWGMIVWESTGYNNGDNAWKGDNHSKKGVPDGTYFYIVSFGHHSGPIGSENRIQGFIVISR